MLLFIIHLSITLMLCGIIWFIQLIHYPLFPRIGRSGFEQYIEFYRQRIFLFLLPLMTIELVTAILLLISPPFKINAFLFLFSLGLILIVWISTFLIQAPFQGKLSNHLQPKILRLLITTNWIRTLAWSLRALIVIMLFYYGKDLF